MIAQSVPAYQFVDLILRQALRLVPPRGWAERVALWWGPRFRGGPRVVKLRGGIAMLVEPKDYMLINLYYLGTFEGHCLRLLPRLLPPGGTLLDVGANLGVYTLSGAKAVGPQGRVIAVEPVPAIAAALRANVERNGFGQVTVRELAAGSAPGQASLVLPPDGNSGMFTLGDSDRQSGPRVSVGRLDDLLDDCKVDRVDLVKMDVEGSEYAALLGASRLIAAHHPTFLIELNDPALERHGHSSREVKALFHDAGYRGWIVARKGLIPVDRTTGHACDECLFIHNSATSVLAAVARERRGSDRCA